MIKISITQFLIVTGFLAGSCVSLIIYIHKNQTARINKIELEQNNCPVNKIYTILETVRKDICWIKKYLK